MTGIRANNVCIARMLCKWTACILALLAVTSRGVPHDMVIKSGLIYDGSPAPAHVGDVAIEDGRIVATGQIESDADRIIDADGLIVAPGFIDIHTHATFSEAQIDSKNTAEIQSLPRRRPARNYLHQGVTTVVSGNCGDGTFHIARTFRDIETHGAGVNVMLLVGHAVLREAVMGMADTEASAARIASMKRLLRQAMREGAVGMSTGLYYAPGNYAATDEIVELAGVVSEYDGIYATHMRDEGARLLEAVQEAIHIGRTADVPVQISHLKVFGRHEPDMAAKATALIEKARREGVEVFADQYPYLAGSTKLASLITQPWVRAGGPQMMLERLRDPSLRTKIRRQATELIHQLGGPEAFVIAYFHQRPAWNGSNLKQIARHLHMGTTAAALNILRIGNPQMVVFAMNERDLRHFMTRSYVMTASDSWNPPYKVGLYHPRNYGTFARKIRRYVIEEQVIGMARAIHAATALPAGMLGLTDRGRIQPGFAADIVVFDPKRIAAPATYENPHEYCQGIEYVLINGGLAIDDGECTGLMAGRPLRHFGRQSQSVSCR